MALNATFAADFSSFQRAVRDSHAALVDLSKGADKVGPSLNRLVDGFSGRKMIQEALLMEKAIEAIGGTSKLTAKELEAVGVKAQEAVAKMRALGVDVPKGLQNLASSVTQVKTASAGLGSNLTSMLGTVAPLAAGLGIAFSGAAVVSGIKNLITGTIEAGSRIKELHLQSGLSTDTLQALGAAGRTVGVTMQSIAMTAQQLSQRIAGGDQSASKAVLELGLNLTAIGELDVDQQLRQVADALGQVTDQGKQAALAQDLFGRQGIQLVKILRDNGGSIDELTAKMKASNQVMEKETIEALDEAQAAWERLGQKVTTVTGKMIIGLFDAVDKFAEARRRLRVALGTEAEQEIPLIPPVPSHGPGLVPVPSHGGPDIVPFVGPAEMTAQERRSWEALQRTIQETDRDQRARAEAAAQDLAQWITQTDKLQRSMREAEVATTQFYRQGMAWMDLGSQTTLPKDFRLIATTAGDATDEITTMNRAVRDGSEAAIGVWDPLIEDAKEVKSVTEQMTDTLGDVSMILANIPGQFAEIASVAARTGQAIIKNLGEGDWVGAITSAAVGLAQILTNIGGPNEAQRQARSDQAAFIKELERTATAQQKLDIAATRGSREYATLAIRGRDAMLAIGKSAAEAERVVKDLLDTENPANFARAMGQVEDALDLQTRATQTLEDTLGRYKFSIEELGPALRNQRLSEQAQQLFKDWEVLSKAGINVAAISREMSAGISEYIQTAIKLGTEVDPAMRTMLETMAANKELVDENGEVITDLEDAGVKFALTMSEGFKSLIDEVKKLTDTIRIGLGLAIESVPDLEIDVKYNDPGFEVPNLPQERLPQLQGGTHGRYPNWGRGTPVVLHGFEKVTPLGQGGGEGGVNVTVNVHGSVITERDLVRTVSDQLAQDLRLRQKMRAA